MTTLPDAAELPGDFAFLFDNAGRHWLAYEVVRDFLSVPRRFAIVVVTTGDNGWIYLDDRPEDTEWGTGLHRLEEAPWHFILRSADCLLNVKAEKLELAAVVYQQAGARQALLDFLQQLPT